MASYLKKTLLAVSTVALLSAQSHASSEEIEEVSETRNQIVSSQDINYSESIYQDIIVKGQEALASLESKLNFAQSSCDATRDRLETYPENTVFVLRLENEEKFARALLEKLSTKQELLVKSYLYQCELANVPVLHGCAQEAQEAQEAHDAHEDDEDALVIETSGPGLLDILITDEIPLKIISYTSPYSRDKLTQTCSRLNFLCEDYTSRNPFVMFKEIVLNYQGYAFGNVKGDYLVCGEPKNISELMIVNANTLEIQALINGVPFSWSEFYKPVGSGNSLIIPNLNDQVHQFYLVGGASNDQIIFTNVKSECFGVFKDRNGTHLVISEYEEDLGSGALLLLDPETEERVVLVHQAGIFCEKSFVSLGNSWYLTLGYDGTIICTNSISREVVFSNSPPAGVNFHTGTGNGLGKFVCQSYDDRNSSSYHLGSFDADTQDIVFSPLNINLLPENYSFSNMFLSQNCLITLGSTVSYIELYGIDDDYTLSSSILTIHDVTTGEHIYTYNFLEDSRFCPSGSELSGTKLYVASETKDEENRLSILDLRNLI